MIVEEKYAGYRFTSVWNPFVQTSGILFVGVEINLEKLTHYRHRKRNHFK